MAGMNADVQLTTNQGHKQTGPHERIRVESRMMPVVRRFERLRISFCLLFSHFFIACSVANFGNGDDAELLFAKRVLPLLKEKCFSCHGNMPGDIKADLDMRTREAMLRGNELNNASYGSNRQLCAIAF